MLENDCVAFISLYVNNTVGKIHTKWKNQNIATYLTREKFSRENAKRANEWNARSETVLRRRKEITRFNYTNINSLSNKKKSELQNSHQMSKKKETVITGEGGAYTRLAMLFCLQETGNSHLINKVNVSIEYSAVCSLNGSGSLNDKRKCLCHNNSKIRQSPG